MIILDNKKREEKIQYPNTWLLYYKMGGNH
jgi:hypothetical protein